MKKENNSGYNYRMLEVNKLQAKMIKMLEEENTRLKIKVNDLEIITSQNKANTEEKK